MADSNAPADGPRPMRLRLPATRGLRFAAQVEGDIAALAKLGPDDEAMLRAFERIAEQDLREWS